VAGQHPVVIKGIVSEPRCKTLRDCPIKVLIICNVNDEIFCNWTDSCFLAEKQGLEHRGARVKELE